MIKAKEFDVESGNVIFQAINITNDNKSMIKVEEIEFENPTNTELLGRNLVIEGKIKGPDKHHPFKRTKASTQVSTNPNTPLRPVADSMMKATKAKKKKILTFP